MTSPPSNSPFSNFKYLRSEMPYFLSQLAPIPQRGYVPKPTGCRPLAPWAATLGHSFITARKQDRPQLPSIGGQRTGVRFHRTRPALATSSGVQVGREPIADS